jgi:diaminopimelate decarboxylase
LHAGGLAVDELAAAAGTPVYLYVLDAVEAAYRRLQTAFQPGRVLYSVKTNGNLALLRRLAAMGAGFDVVSGGELLRVLRASGWGFLWTGSTSAAASRSAMTEARSRPPEAFAAALAPLLAGAHAEVEVEPGRALVARAGALVAKVLAVKPRPGGRAVVVDTGKHHLLRPALYRARHRVVPVRLGPPAGAGWLVGPICESADVLAWGVPLPDLAPGDQVAVLDVGAYGMVMASNYNGQPRPAEVAVTGGQALITRRRETWEDLLAWESMPARRLAVGGPLAAAPRSPSAAHRTSGLRSGGSPSRRAPTGVGADRRCPGR